MAQHLTKKGNVQPGVVLGGTACVDATFGLSHRPKHGARCQHDDAQQGDAHQQLNEREAFAVANHHRSLPSGWRTGLSVTRFSCLVLPDTPQLTDRLTWCSSMIFPDKCT